MGRLRREFGHGECLGQRGGGRLHLARGNAGRAARSRRFIAARPISAGRPTRYPPAHGERGGPRSSIAITPGRPEHRQGGGPRPFIATGTYSDGSTANLTPQVTWASSNPAAATISNAPGSQGTATGTGIGSAGISASLNGVTSPTDTLTVTAAALASIALTPASPSAPKGTTEPFTATGTYTDGTTANLTPQVTWASGTPTVATIGPSGVASAVSPGTAGITASLNGVTSPSDPLTVTAAALLSIAVSPSHRASRGADRAVHRDRHVHRRHDR